MTEQPKTRERDIYLNSPDPGHRAMVLPEGMTCGDCYHCARCVAIFGHVPADEVCDWYPSRFLKADRRMKSECRRGYLEI
ncbi:hypothetical protein LCGC14_1254100 [marine sediment metagenome]|uniref:Uncharacterized protein n=1 Tax=marine sediment metagenome TaxID=412755 RepID=A0A0F9L5M3_9ZZZZ